MGTTFDRRLVVVTGKGGVGKSTVAASLALAAARRGRKVLVALCNANERLSALLDGRAVGDSIAEVSDGIDAVNMVPERCLEEYGMMVLRIRAVYRTVFENKMVRAFLRAVPGLHEWAMLGKAWFHATEEKDGRPRYDLVILDAPSTGHGVDLLRVPKVILDIAPKGPLRRDAEAAWDLLRDPKRSETMLVTVAEEMPVTETRELHDRLAIEMGFPVPRIVVNGVLPTLFDAPEEAAVLAARPAGESESLVASARSRIVRTRLQRRQVARLAEEIRLPQVVLPFVYGPEFGRSAIEKISEDLARQIG